MSLICGYIERIRSWVLIKEAIGIIIEIQVIQLLYTILKIISTLRNL